MHPQIIIDGHNMIYRASDLRVIMNRSPEDARDTLIHKLNVYKARKRIKISLVFDGDRVGRPSRQKVGGIDITYSMKPQTADAVIKLMLQKHKNPVNVLVISSDSSVLQFAKTCRTKVQRSEEFYKRHLTVDSKPASPDKETDMSTAELEVWMQIFDSKKNDQRPKS